MTWSIVARDAAGALGVAVATKFFAVGALCTHGRSGVAALATQALVNPLYGPRGLDLLAGGANPAAVVAALIRTDDGRDQRQLHMIDARGRIAAHTGSRCIDWCGHAAGYDFSVAGNMLAGPRVIAETAAFYATHPELPFAERLIGALEAGEAAGATSAASNPRRCASIPPKAIPPSTCASMMRSNRLANCAACTASAWNGFSLSLLACQARRGRPASPIAR